MILNKDNYFELLGVSENATDREIRLAYTQALRKYPHEQYPEEFQLFTLAKDTLLDAEKKEKYLRKLHHDDSYDRLVAEGYQLYNQDKLYEANAKANELFHLGYDNDVEVLLLASSIALKMEDTAQNSSYIYKLETQYAHVEAVKFHLCSYYDVQGDYRKAISYANQIVSQLPQDLQAFVYLLDLYSADGQIEQVKQTIKKRMANRELRLQDYPILNRGLFVGVATEDRTFLKQVITELKRIAQKDKYNLLNIIIDSAAQVTTDKYIYKFLISLVDDLNNGEFSDVNSWVKNGYDIAHAELIYFELDERKQQQLSQPSYSSSSSRYSQSESNAAPYVESNGYVEEQSVFRGSLLWAIIFGTIFAFVSESVMTGIVVGLIWYFLGGLIKGLIGCLIIIGVVISIIGVIFG